MKTLILTFVQVVHDTRYPCGTEASDKKTEIHENSRLNDKFVTEFVYLLEDNESADLYVYPLTSNLVEDLDGKRTVLNSYPLNSDIMDIYDRSEMDEYERYMNFIWKSPLDMLSHTRNKTLVKPEFRKFAKYLFDVSKHLKDRNCDIRISLVTHKEYEDYKNSIKSP